MSPPSWLLGQSPGFLALAGLTVVSLAYYGLTVVAAVRWRRAAEGAAADRPLAPISVLRPVKGLDARAYESFAGFCRQDCPEYELLFGVLDPDDPVIPLIERLRREFPEVPIRLVVGSPRIGSNLKVCNLAALTKHARHDLLVHCDSDMRVTPDFLRRVTAPLQDPSVGLVTCLYRGAEAHTLADKLEAQGIVTDFVPSVLVSRLIRPIDFALGSGVAFHRSVLERIGGFEALADYLADDYELGHRVRGLGKQVVVADTVLEDVLPGEGLRDMLTRRVRWARTVRLAAPAGYRASGVTHGTTLALLALLVGGGTVGWGLLAATWVCRLVSALYVGRWVMGDRGLAGRLWLMPASDLLSALIWFAGLFGSRVCWRGTRYRIQGDGRMVPEPRQGTAGR